MSQNSRFSDVLHILLHLLDAEKLLTSARIGLMLGTNAVVVRRIMSGLRNAGLVSSEKGHGGGWKVSCTPQTTTLADVHAALGSPPIFSVGNRSENPQCLVERCVQDTLGHAVRKAEALLLKSLRQITLAELSADFSSRMKDFKAVPSGDGEQLQWVKR